MTVTKGLRERKKRQTLDSIQRHAVRLFLHDGYDNVTVDMICDAAGISQRTFFNYVGSKENALLGSMPPLPDERQCAAYVAGLGGTPFEDLVHMLTEVFVDVGDQRAALIRQQFAVIRANTDLTRREAAHMEQAREKLVDLVRARMDLHGGGHDPSVAEMTVSLAFTVFRQLRGEWAHAAPDAPAAASASAAADRAIEMLRAVASASP